MTTESLKILQTFGWDSVSYKVLVQAKSGNRYLLWYYYPLAIEVGQEVLISFSYNTWVQINNPRNGKSSKIHQVSKIS
ncbi:MAG: hypothetical protein F6K45_22920 [Kamptonema sp. SIO1D9]|nr:hypothetical protein [Kamptonema sp. SIO1D9]